MENNGILGFLIEIKSTGSRENEGMFCFLNENLETDLPILKMTNSLSFTFGIATTPSGSTVTRTYNPPWREDD